MERVTKFNLINDDYDIDSTCGIRYTVKVDLTISDLFEIAPLMLFDILLNNTDVNILSVDNDNYISFNKYGKNEYNFDFECCNEIKKRYINKDNSPVTYTVELCNLTPETYEALPSKIKEALPYIIEYDRPKFSFIKPEVKVITRYTEEKRLEIEDQYLYKGNTVHYKDFYAWCNLDRELFKEYQSPHKKFYWQPQDKKFAAQFNEIETIQQLINDIAENGLRTELRFEVSTVGQLSSVIESGHRFLTAMFLGLPYIPACLIYRRYDSVPFMGTDNRYKSQNPDLINFLNRIYYPDMIFRYFGDNIPSNTNKKSVHYDEILSDIKEIIKEDFPKKIYCKNEDLPIKYSKALETIWN